MDQYRTSGILDKAAYRELNKFSVAPWRVWFSRIWSVLMGIFAVLMLIVQDYAYFALFFSFTILFALGPWIMRRRHLRSAFKVLDEAYPEGYVRLESFFTVDGVSLHNLSNGAQAMIPYESLKLVRETEHYFCVGTKARQSFTVFKDCLTPEQRESFLPFLKERCPGLKIKK